ncbi:MAG TPA: DUF5916 domain-containing protein [Cyclobacteriaceae bacterium]
MAQPSNSFVIHQLTESIVIDGELNDRGWQIPASANSFNRNFPDDNSKANHETEVKITFDTENLYVAARMQRNADKKYSVSSLKKDFVFYDNDAFGIIIDPFNDLTNGYGFYVNAYGARRDEQISSGTVVDATMDIKWNAEVKRTPEYYAVEMVIPLKYIRHADNTFWNVNFVRNDMSANERSSWIRTPINFLLSNLAFVGKMYWNRNIPSKNKLYSFIPSIALKETKEAGSSFEARLKPSLDSKIALSSSMNMDVTINPDFSQAEIDKVQVNTTRFELAFPENRLFFIENSDLFSGFGDASGGNPANRPLYSRKIGLRYDSTVSGYIPTPIIGGSRISGKINNNLRFGGMTLFSKSEKVGEEKYIPAQNYSVLALQQKIFARSSIAAMFVNRQAFGTDSLSHFALSNSDYNRTLALEYNFASRNDKYSGKVYHHFLSDATIGNSEYAQGFLFRHNTRQWRNWFQVTQITPHFRPDAGFVPRTDLLAVNLQGAYSWFPKKGKVNQFELTANPQFHLTSKAQYSDHKLFLGLHVITKKTEELWFVNIQERINLKAPFDPTFSEGIKLDSGDVHMYNYGVFAYTSDSRQSFYWQTVVDAGQYYNGTQLRAEGVFNYRLQPWGTIGLNYNIGRYKLPKPYSENLIFYVGPKAELTFTRNLFLTSMAQYNSLANNMNYYFRLQWRFMPLSDLFVIYSANRDTENHQFRNQNIVLKAALWL